MERWFGLSTAQKLPSLRYFTSASAVLARGLLDNHNEGVTSQQWLYMQITLDMQITLVLALAGLVMRVSGVFAIMIRKSRI